MGMLKACNCASFVESPYRLSDLPGQLPERTDAHRWPVRGGEFRRNVQVENRAIANPVPETSNFRKRAAARGKSQMKTGGLNQGSLSASVYQAASIIRQTILSNLSQGGGQ